MPKVSPLERTLRLYRARGFVVGKTERWIGPPQKAGEGFNPMRRRVDFCGFADAIAFKGGEVIALQACATSGISEHRKKYLQPTDEVGWRIVHDLRAWLHPDGRCRFVIVGWQGKERPGKALREWCEREVEITLADLPAGHFELCEYEDERPSDEDREAWAALDAAFDRHDQRVQSGPADAAPQAALPLQRP